VRLSPEVLRLQRERDAPIPIVRRPAAEAPLPVPTPVPTPLMPDEGTPHRGRPLVEVHEPSAPHGAATDRVLIEPDGIDDRRTRRRFVALTAVGGVAAVVLGVTVGVVLVDGVAEDAPAVVHGGTKPERKSTRAPDEPTTGAGPQLRPIATTESADVAEVRPARPLAPAPVVEVPAASPPPMPAAATPPPAATPVVERPATPVPAAPSATTADPEPRTATPKPRPAPPRVEIDIRNEWVEQGIELRIGKTTFAVPVRKITTFPAGRHPMQWRKIGESQWRAVGKHDLAKDMRHVILVGVVANAPSGLKIVSKAVAR